MDEMSIVLRSLGSDRKATYTIPNMNHQVDLQFKHFYSAVSRISTETTLVTESYEIQSNSWTVYLSSKRDSGDSDYLEYRHAESRMEDCEPVARPAKRQRWVDTGMDTSQLHNERVRAHAYPTSCLPRLASPEPIIQRSTNTETIRIQGQFLRKVSLSLVEYCCFVKEDINSTASNPASSDILASIKRLADQGASQSACLTFKLLI